MRVGSAGGHSAASLQKSAGNSGAEMDDLATLERSGECWTLTMRAGDNRFNPRFVAALNAALDAVLAEPEGAACLLLTSSSPKFFSNGLDIEGMEADALATFVQREFEPFLARLIAFPVPTVAVINGHAFAGGFMLALACDYRVMNAERGYACLNEVQLGLPLTPGMSALVSAKLSSFGPSLLRDAVLQGRRLGAAEALRRGAIDAKAPPAALSDAAGELAAPLARFGANRYVYSALKEGLYGEALQLLRAGASAEASSAPRDRGAVLDATADPAAEVLYEAREDGVALITLNRPRQLNALTMEMQVQYFEALERADRDERVRCVVVSGAGRGFCVGADMAMLKTVSTDHEKLLADPSRLPRRNLDHVQALKLRKPLIAAINGPAAGLGLVLALMADVRFAGAGAKFTTAFAKRGLIAEHGVAWLLPRLVGLGAAQDLLLSSRVLRGEEAQRLGLVNFVVPDSSADAVLGRALDYAAELAASASPAGCCEMKQQLYDGLDASLPDALGEANQLMRDSFNHPDFAEGVASFLERRAPRFPGLSAGRIRAKL